MKYERYKDELSHHGVKGMKWGIRKQQKDAKKLKNHSEINRKSSVKKTLKTAGIAVGIVGGTVASAFIAKYAYKGVKELKTNPYAVENAKEFIADSYYGMLDTIYEKMGY